MKRERFRHLRGDSRLFPFAARTALRRRQRRAARLLRTAGIAALCLAGVLVVRESLLRGGQPDAPRAAAVTPAPTETVAPIPVRAATVDALAATEAQDEAAPASPAPQPTAGPEQTARILPRYRELYEQNPDLVGWLRMEGTRIDYPVVQVPGDNSSYLRRGFDRLYSTGGTLLLDGRCVLGGPGRGGTANALIYGHNMANGSMFADLVLYRQESFYREHPTFTFDTLTREGTWQIVAAVDTVLGADALPYYTFFDAADRAEWQRRVDAILALSLYDTGVAPEYGDELLTLSTCGETSAATDRRFAVLAVRIETGGQE